APAPARLQRPHPRRPPARPGQPARPPPGAELLGLVGRALPGRAGGPGAGEEGLELVNRALAGRDARLVGVNIRDDQGAAVSYLEEFGVAYPSLFDRPATLAARLGARGPQAPPYTLVVDAQGRVAARVF